MRTRSAAALILSGALAGGCGLFLGSDDYAIGLTSTGTGTGGAGGSAGTSSASSPSMSSTSATSSSGIMTSGTGGSEAHTVIVSPSAPTLLALATQTFAATIDGAPSTSVTWSVVEPSGGTVSTKGAYTAPLAEGTYHLRATSVATPSDHGDATILVKRDLLPVTIAPAGPMGSIVAPTGNGSQSHLAYTAGTGEWWLFYNVAGMPVLATARSKDFVAWQAGESLMLLNMHSSDGRDLSVASTTINGHDVVHLTQGYVSNGLYGRYHIRAVASAGHMSFDAPRDVNYGGDSTPDGASTLILPDGSILDSTGWEPTPATPRLSPCGNGDVEAFRASSPEDGIAPFGDVLFKRDVLWCVGNHVNARQLLSIGQTVIHLYEDGQSDGAPVNILMSRRDAGGSWFPTQDVAKPKVVPPTVFAVDKAFGLDDWTGTVAGGVASAVRRVGASFEYRVLGSDNLWMDGAPIPDQPTTADSGLFLAPYGDGLVLVALGGAMGSKVVYTVFDGSAWSPWAPLITTMATRSYLGGFAPPPPARPALIWTESGAVDSIVGVVLP